MMLFVLSQSFSKLCVSDQLLSCVQVIHKAFKKNLQSPNSDINNCMMLFKHGEKKKKLDLKALHIYIKVDL